MSTPPRHLPGLDNANVVKTKTVASAEHKLSSAINRHGIAVVSGAPGNGKSFTVDQFLNTHPSVAGRTVHWLDMPPNPAPKEVTVRLLIATGTPFSSRETLYELTELLIPALDGRVVVIDEAQNLKQNALQQVRYFHDQGRAMAVPWSLILVGSTVDSAMSRAPELHSRVAARVEFTAMDAETLLRAVRDWHPTMAALDPKLILQVDATYGYGNWRRWGQLLSALLDLMAKMPAGTPVTPQHVAAALSVVQGMSTRPGRIHVVDDHAGLTRNIFVATFTDVPNGRVGVWARPDTSRMNTLSMDLMTAFGVQDGFHGNGRPAQARLEHVVAWARAHHTRHVYVQNAFLPQHPVIKQFLSTAITVGWDIWMVGDTGYRTTVQASIEDFCRNNGLQPPNEVSAQEFLSTFDLSPEPAPPAAPDETAEPVDALTSSWPEHLPADDYRTFRSACRELLTPEAFAEVDEFFVRHVHAGIELAASLPSGTTEREEAIAVYLQQQWHRVDSVSHFMVLIRATQVALFRSQLHMRVMLNRLLGTAETMPHDALRNPEPWERLRVYADPARGATCAVAATGADPDELLGLKMSDVAPDGSTVLVPDGLVEVFEHAQVFVRAFREVRLLDGAGKDDLYFATHEGPMPEVRIRRYLRDARREVELVVTAPLKLWDRSGGSRWYTRWGLTIREVA